MQIRSHSFSAIRVRLQGKIVSLSKMAAWKIILLSIFLWMIPFLFLEKPDTQLEQLASFLALGVLPIFLAAWLRARRGALLTAFILLCYLVFLSLHFHGFSWFIQVDASMFIAAVLGYLIIALIAGHVQALSIQLAHAHDEAVTSHTSLLQAYEVIQAQALTDALTGLPNHRSIIEHFEKELDRVQRYGHTFSLLFFDADRFKHINDTYGHAHGDTVLRYLGERASSVLRKGDTLGRFGGEEFIILLPETDAQEAACVAERIRARIAADPVPALEVAGGIPLTISIGLATYPEDGRSQETLLTQADEAMYLAKRLGRNQVRTAREVRQMQADPMLLALVEEATSQDRTSREASSPVPLKHYYSQQMVESLMGLLERRDQGILEHSYAVRDLATTLAEQIGQTPHQIQQTAMAALLHDIGKVGLPDALLHKASRLSAQDRALIKEHSILGAQILSVCPFLNELIPAVRHHHERWDAAGYPDQLGGEDIPLTARIITIAEAYITMVSAHPYQAPWTSEAARAELRRCAGTQFDPQLVEILLSLDQAPHALQIAR